MSARKRKTLGVCRQCHDKIRYGRHDRVLKHPSQPGKDVFK